jgi:hypothetical protein
MTEQPERELDEMQERSDRLEEEIGDVREDWESKKQDPGVPGAVPEGDEPSESDGERQA